MPAHTGRRRLRMAALVVACIILIGTGLALSWSFISHGPPVDFFVRGSDVIAVDRNHRELWRYTSGLALRQEFYEGYIKPLNSWLGDLYGDGHKQLVIVLKAMNESTINSPVVCLAENGKLKWSFTPGRTVRDEAGSTMLPPYYTNRLLVIKGRTTAETRIVVSSNHYMEQPNQVALLDAQGRVVGEYWHPGHLLYLAEEDLDGDGNHELLLGGVNNGNHQATMVVLDPLKVVGLMTPVEMKDTRFRLLDMPAAQEKAVVFFPRSFMSRGQAYTRVRSLWLTRYRIIVEVTEGVSETLPGFVYELDYGLRPVNLTPDGPQLRVLYQALERRNEVHHTFSEELEQLKANISVHRPRPAN